jgi:hypothetical protein
MNGQDIPGFYFDTEKKKYFQIQNAQATRHQHLDYSAESIRKKQRTERLHRTATAQIQRTRKERVIRHDAGHLTQTCLEREIGFKRRPVYMQASWPNACVSGVSAKPKMIVERPKAPIRLFDQDAASGTIYAVHGDNSIQRRRIHIKGGPPLPSPDMDLEIMSLNAYSFEPWDELQRTTSTVSSLCYLPATGAIATTTYGSDRPPVVCLSDPERDGPYVCQQFTPKGCFSIFATAARPLHSTHSSTSTPPSDTEHLAVAASSSMLLFTRSPTGDWSASTPLQDLKADILALTWISPTTIALGCRNGKIMLYDTRSRGSSHILTHPCPISKLAPADDPTRLVVSGLQDSLFLYDIRSPRISPSSTYNHANQYNTNENEYKIQHHYNDDYFNTHYGTSLHQKKKRKLNHVALTKWSQPVLSFPHANTDDAELDIAVHERLGLVAAGQDEETGVAIRVSNLWTGKTLREITASGGGKGRIRCLKFMNEEDRGVEIWAGWNGGVGKFVW